jgi:hypothetical protein
MRHARLALVLAGIAGSAAAGDMTVRQSVATAGGSAPGVAHERTQYFTDRVVVTEDTKLRAIVDLDTETLTFIDKVAKTYTVRSFDALRQQAVEARKAAGEPAPREREALGLDAPVTVRSTGRTREIAGRTATEYALASTRARGRVWVADGLQLPASGREWEKVSASMQHSTVRPGAQLAVEAAKLSSLPLRTSLTVKVGKQRLTSTNEVLEIREGPPPAGVLAVPAGFTKK